MPGTGRRLRPLNRPRPIDVTATGAGVPVRLRIGRERREVGAVLDRWRIDDEWWREPISRVYFSLVLEGGAHLVLYHDLVDGRWYRHSG